MDRPYGSMNMDQQRLSIEEYLKMLEQYDSQYEEEGFQYAPFVSIFDILDAPRELPDPEQLTSRHLKQIENELGLIKLCWPVVEHPEFEGRSIFPDSYRQNTDKEKLLLFTTENFRRQFKFKFPDRKQLFLACDNECGIQKMVCTSIRPTLVPHTELETLELCAQFIGGHHSFEPLELATLFPNRLCSPSTTILRQSGNCFELSTVLCSMLLGLGYDAYVVSGYAIHDVTMKNMTRVDSPYPPQEEKVEEKVEQKVSQKYALKPLRDFRSKLLMMLEQREVDKKLEIQRKELEAKREQEKLEAAYPPDELDGMRIHSWILVLTNGKTMEEPCFVEPTSGFIYTLDTHMYNGIESVWNHENYWVNMQKCDEGNLSLLDYDLSNVEKWEHILVGEPIRWRIMDLSTVTEEEEMERMKVYQEKHLDMPVSWSTEISIPHEVLANKFPRGSRSTWYKRTLVQEFAPYVHDDGLVLKVTRFTDFDCNDAYCIEDTYEYRTDKMIRVVANLKTKFLEVFFRSGREDCVIKHSYYDNEFNVDEMIIDFNSNARYDSLSQLRVLPDELTETYVNKENRLYSRRTDYAPKGIPPPGMVEGHKRIIMKIVEKFSRDDTKPADKDIAQREFYIYTREIHLQFHRDLGKVTSSTRKFIKPPISEMGESMKFYPELTSGYHADVNTPPPRKLELFLLLQEQLQEEEKTIHLIRDMEDQIAEFRKLRCLEIASVELEVDLFNREHNEEFRLGMLEKEKEQQEHKAKEIQDVIDYVQPYVERLSNKKEVTNRLGALKIRDWCLTEFREILLQRANNIQKQFDNTTEGLARKKQWYIMNQDKMKAIEEIEYFEEMNSINFTLQSLEERLCRHRDLSHERYKAMVRYLETHPLLEKFF